MAHINSNVQVRTVALADDKNTLGIAEQIALLALLISLVAMSIDAILPALPNIGSDLAVIDANAPQFLISALLIGLTLGQLVYGPISDSYGRRGPIIVGLMIFLVGSVICAAASDFETVLIGRVVQGVGAAGPRVVAIALVRDQYSGAAMARIMSFVMAVFILVPAFAPLIGELVMDIAGSWRAIFAMFFLHAGLATLWFVLRQLETHPTEKRRTLTLSRTLSDMGRCLAHPVSRGYAVAAGLVFGSFVGFLTSVQQIFTTTLGDPDNFTTAFAVLALSIGAASITNSQLVMQLGMQRLSSFALAGLIVLSFAGWLVSLSLANGTPVWMFMALMMPTSFCFGILFGNFNALAMEPMQTIAGSASAIIASMTSLIAVSFGTLVGQAFDGTAAPMFAGFLIAGVGATLILRYTEGVRSQAAEHV
ncbi:MAG: multidrug effflux MFS transporter [Pseudomonadota bacterium]